jgi:hypothetical protein
MGTNYYLHKPLQNACEHCWRGDEAEVIHLGKGSAGWCFSLHVYPEDGLTDWSEVKAWLQDQIANGGHILNEYKEEVSLDDFESTVTKRLSDKDWDSGWWAPKPFGTTQDGKQFFLPGYTSEADFHAANYSQRGPNSLLRHRITDRHCFAHGSGTWDCITGEFS